MKSIILTLAFLALIVSSCTQATPPSPGVNNEKLTLEEIRNDSNWVEIMDTLHLPDIEGLNSVYSKWKNATGILITNTSEYNALSDLLDTTNFHYKPLELSASLNYDKYSMIGLLTQTTPANRIPYLFKNKTTKSYKYFVKLDAINHTEVLTHNQSWLRVPKIEIDYSITYDTLWTWEKVK